MEEYEPEAILKDSQYFRKASRELVEAQSTVKRLALSVVGRRRRGSPATANGYVVGVGRLSAFLGLQPDEVIEQARAGKLDLVQKINSEGTGFIDNLLNSGLANKTVWSWLAGVKRWTEVNEVQLDWSKIERPTAAIVKNKDRAPTPGELKQILSYSDVKERAIISLLATSGLRIGTALSLKWRELDFSRPDVVKITVAREMGRKFGRYMNQMNGEVESYTTFSSTGARTALLAHKRSLEESGELVRPDSFVFPATRTLNKMSVSSWQWRWYRLLARSGLTEKSVDHYLLRTHSLRKYFRSRAVGLDTSYRESMMGHRGRYLDTSYLRTTEQELYEAYIAVMPRLEVDVAEGEEEVRELRKKYNDLKAQLEQQSRQEANQAEINKALTEEIQAIKKMLGTDKKS